MRFLLGHREVATQSGDLTAPLDRRDDVPLERLPAVLVGRKSGRLDDGLRGALAVEPSAHHQDAHGVVQGQSTLHHEGKSEKVRRSVRWHQREVAVRARKLTTSANCQIEAIGCD
jgi:hypothetical protein